MVHFTTIKHNFFFNVATEKFDAIVLNMELNMVCL